MATNGDFLLATCRDFLMARDTLTPPLPGFDAVTSMESPPQIVAAALTLLPNARTPKEAEQILAKASADYARAQLMVGLATAGLDMARDAALFDGYSEHVDSTLATLKPRLDADLGRLSTLAEFLAVKETHSAQRPSSPPTPSRRPARRRPSSPGSRPPRPWYTSAARVTTAPSSCPAPLLIAEVGSTASASLAALVVEIYGTGMPEHRPTVRSSPVDEAVPEVARGNFPGVSLSFVSSMVEAASRAKDLRDRAQREYVNFARRGVGVPRPARD